MAIEKLSEADITAFLKPNELSPPLVSDKGTIIDGFVESISDEPEDVVELEIFIEPPQNGHSIDIENENLNFDQLYSKLQVPLYWYLLKGCGDAKLAEDLVQETFLLAIESVQVRHASVREVRGWIFSIARNLQIDHFRRETRRPLVDIDEIPISYTIEMEKEVDRDNNISEVNRRLELLTPRQMNVVELRLNGLSFLEISGILGTTEGAVKK